MISYTAKKNLENNRVLIIHTNQSKTTLEVHQFNENLNILTKAKNDYIKLIRNKFDSVIEQHEKVLSNLENYLSEISNHYKQGLKND